MRKNFARSDYTGTSEEELNWFYQQLSTVVSILSEAEDVLKETGYPRNSRKLLEGTIDAIEEELRDMEYYAEKEELNIY